MATGILNLATSAPATGKSCHPHTLGSDEFAWVVEFRAFIEGLVLGGLLYLFVPAHMLWQAGWLRVNMGNIHLEEGLYAQAIKMYRMALDQLPPTLKRLRLNVMRNIGITFLRAGRFQVGSVCLHSITAQGRAWMCLDTCSSTRCLHANRQPPTISGEVKGAPGCHGSPNTPSRSVWFKT